jgi:RHS repeat-associated protein
LNSLYTSYERDGDGGDEAMFRRYESKWSRFVQPDPYDGSYELADPQSFNRYAYTRSDPVNFVDPNGLLINGFCVYISGSEPAGGGYWVCVDAPRRWGGYRGNRGNGASPNEGPKEQKCEVEPLKPLTDPGAQTAEQGGGDEIDLKGLTVQTLAGIVCLGNALESGGGHFDLNSAYRSPSYQVHLQEVWDKNKQLKNNTNPACQKLKQEVAAEMAKHELTERPAGATGPHTKGIAFDAGVQLGPEHRKQKVSIRDLAQRCGLHQPNQHPGGGHHFQPLPPESTNKRKRR